VVQPAPETLSVHGHEIRNLLILAATEVEMHWRGILVAIGRTAKFNTNEYVKLADVLGLPAFTVRFHPCPDIDPFSPFALWEATDPTNSLPRFSAYLGVKHNREFEFERAIARREGSGPSAPERRPRRGAQSLSRSPRVPSDQLSRSSI